MFEQFYWWTEPVICWPLVTGYFETVSEASRVHIMWKFWISTRHNSVSVLNSWLVTVLGFRRWCSGSASELKTAPLVAHYDNIWLNLASISLDNSFMLISMIFLILIQILSRIFYFCVRYLYGRKFLLNIVEMQNIFLIMLKLNNFILKCSATIHWYNKFRHDKLMNK